MEYARLWQDLIRLALIISLLVLAVMAVVVGMVFVFIGLYVALAETMKPWEAGIIVGIGILFFATILVLIFARQGRAVSPKGTPISEQFTHHFNAQLKQIVGNTITQPNINIKSSDIVLTALIGGIVLGASPRLRQRVVTTLPSLIKFAGQKLLS
ncbi:MULTISPECIES: hypothetical protein [Nitrosomonas]|uniref:Putative membrane protein (DUF2079) n=1 Tax=Nitrosomonas communis TaxID=44574 RepID=A0A5D3YB43_9PROT|nr:MULTISPECIES: hypothetical protein [Nitrosomonas]TYP86660.1 putative membrane protein (DUF2079) [Nitrosomonas communis]UVS62052.1 hypothetical protein NX761_02665 [Nitrosomonas sp. PLL12]